MRQLTGYSRSGVAAGLASKRHNDDASGMIRSGTLPNILTALLLAVPGTAMPAASGRSYVVTDFDRVRVDGPLDVRLTTRGAPAARAEGEIRATDALAIRVEGTTLIVSAGPKGFGEVPQIGTPQAPVIRLATQTLRGATVIGGGKLDIAGPLRAQRVDLQVTGSGSLAAAGIDADQLTATLLGAGAMVLGGRGGRVRLLTSGAGTLDAAALRGDDVTVRLDGAGAIRATARYTADATSTGVGAVTIYGKPACRVKAVAGGPMRCGLDPVPVP